MKPAFVRYVRVSQQKRDAAGKKLCLVCESPLPKRRLSYCSDECFYRNTPRLMRSLVRRRDKGICAQCGSDTKCEGSWEMDHVIPIAEGGGLCGVEGYRTLCIPCHKTVTAELATRLAQTRQDAKRPLLAEMKAAV